MDKGATQGHHPSFSTSPSAPQVALQSKILTIPKAEDMVLWSSLHEAMFGAVSEGGKGGLQRRAGEGRVTTELAWSSPG